ncbi:transcriptional regulator, partial [Pseudomonas aeruginosa]
MGPHHGSALDTARLGVRSAGALFSAKCKAYAGAR